ncbi:MBL fold metallo-hydrolase [Cyanobacterium sp. Dongsha4]|uniref:MBL fold metallo-hydrolase n=1 Tax=Cyanobacterium sp. DS4 TaxID=2878255 RepID=UPI002E80917F|nr:MBL fold metallo-hydrolase [Cyanobacterium sp. Dongsha4]WVL00947.1 MBL fold metallo-hydrolase [Cyanobacterium sp. Dongsha4]
MDSDLNFTEKVNQEKTKVPSRAKYPKLILENIFAFAPNRDTLGGTSYLLIHPLGNILVDCPFWSEENKDFCLSNGVKYLFVTNRDGISKHISHIKKELHCELIIQEQEAYLLPNLSPITFSEEYRLYDDCFGLWTCGYSPASACLYYGNYGGVLFSGRHLLPVGNDKISALKLKKTFHWLRQLRSVQKLCDRFSEKTLEYICPGANTGYLRGQGFMNKGYQKLMESNKNYLVSDNR